MSSIDTDLEDIRERLKRIEENMVTKEDIDSLVETVEILSSKPRILRDIDRAVKEYKRGEYHTYEEVFKE
ncbi:MAG: hypothetical protein ACE5GD_07180 [Candidatus Geothermarchaeales archaeon]